MGYQTIEKAIRKIEARLGRVEKAVFTAKKTRGKSEQQTDHFAGPTGGAKLLASQGFFKAKRSLRDVRVALAKRDYHYGAAQIQTALNRLSTRTGPLAASKEGGKKFYVRRK